MNLLKKHYKKFSKIFVMLFIMILLVEIIIPKKELYKPGSYYGVGKGHHGDIYVIVNVDRYNILSIDIVDEQETPEISQVVYEQLPKKIIRKNTYKVDVVSGVSLTSEGLLKAVESALRKAKR